MKKSSIIKAICLLNLFFFTGVTKAQTLQMEPFPATELGQEILINQSDRLWTPLWQTGEISRANGQAILNAGGDPCNRPTCINGVCCQTVYFWTFGTNNCHFLTTCWDDATGKVLLKIRQDM
jgi:hypothetical protein